MSLSKQQMLGAIGTGVFVLCAGGLGVGLYLAWESRTENVESLEAATQAYDNYFKAKIFPSQKSLDSINSNLTSYTSWYDAAVAVAARGDKRFADETPPIFKQRLQGEVRRMLALTGGADGKIANSAFLFGFEQYLGEGGVLPAKEDVPRLAVQLDTIARVVDIFAEAGILEVKSIKRLDDKPKSEDEEDAPRGKNKKSAKGDDEGGPRETCLTYAFEFMTRPAALVATLNRLTVCERFMTVRNLSFRETADVIVEHLSAAENAENQKASGRSAARGGRRGRRAAAAATMDNGKAGEVDPLVVDPELDAPILVSFTLEVRDFGRAEIPGSSTNAKDANGDDEKKADVQPAEKKESKE